MQVGLLEYWRLKKEVFLTPPFSHKARFCANYIKISTIGTAPCSPLPSH